MLPVVVTITAVFNAAFTNNRLRTEQGKCCCIVLDCICLLLFLTVLCCCCSRHRCCCCCCCFVHATVIDGVCFLSLACSPPSASVLMPFQTAVQHNISGCAAIYASIKAAVLFDEESLQSHRWHRRKPRWLPYQAAQRAAFLCYNIVAKPVTLRAAALQMPTWRF